MYVEVLICIQTVSAVMKSSACFYLCRFLQIFSAFEFTSLQVEIRGTVAVIELPCMQLCRL